MAISPIDYTLKNVPNPFQAIQQGVQMGQSFVTQRQNQEQIDLQRQQLQMNQRAAEETRAAAQAAAAAKLQKDAAKQAWFTRVSKPGYRATAEDGIEALQYMSAEEAKVINDSVNKMQTQEKEGAAKRYGEIYSALRSDNPEIAVKRARDYAIAFKNGGNMSEYDDFTQLADQIEQGDINGAVIRSTGSLGALGDPGKNILEAIKGARTEAREERLSDVEFKQKALALGIDEKTIDAEITKRNAQAQTAVSESTIKGAAAGVAVPMAAAGLATAQNQAVITGAEAGTAVEMAKAKLDEYKAKAAREGVLAKFEESKQVQEAAARGLTIKSLEQDPEIKRQNLALAVLESKLKAEANDLKRQELQATLDAKKEEREAKIAGKVADLQGAQATFDNTLQTIDDILATPDDVKRAATGPIDAMLPTLQPSVADFEAKLDTLKSQVFLTQVEKMKGLGALTEAEGKKIESALQSLSLKQSTGQLMANIQRIRDITAAGRERLAAKYGVAAPAQTAPAPTGPVFTGWVK